MGQNSLIPQGKQNSLPPQENNNMSFQLARDQVLLLETLANCGKFISQLA